MDYFSNTGANAGSALSTKPNAHDFDMLKSMYSHLDSTTTVASFGGNFAEIMAGSEVDVSDDPNSWATWSSSRATGAVQSMNGITRTVRKP